MKLDRSTKKSLAFFILVVMGVGFLNYQRTEGRHDAEERAEIVKQREAEFMLKRAQYIAEYGKARTYDPRTGQITD